MPSLPAVGSLVTTDLYMKIKFGFDGSGSHTIYSQVNNVKTNNIRMNMMFFPLPIENSAGNVIWTQDSPNASKSAISTANGEVSAIFNDDVITLKEHSHMFDKHFQAF